MHPVVGVVLTSVVEVVVLVMVVVVELCLGVVDGVVVAVDCVEGGVWILVNDVFGLLVGGVVEQGQCCTWVWHSGSQMTL